MDRFSIDIEKVVSRLCDEGKKLQGIVALQYPVYCLHATIIDSTPDDIYKTDIMILQLFSSIPDVIIADISSLINIHKKTVEDRIRQLYKEDFLEKRGQNHHVTDIGLEYIKDGSALRLKKRAYDFLIDGITLKPLYQSFYKELKKFLIPEHLTYRHTNRSGKEIERKPFYPDLVFSPISKETIINELDKISTEERNDFEIPLGFQTIESMNFEKLSFPVMVSLSTDNEYNVIKEIVNGYSKDGSNEELRIFNDGLSSLVQKLLIQVRSNKQDWYYMQNNICSINKEKDSVDKILTAAKTDVKGLIKQSKDLEINNQDSINSSDKEVLLRIDSNELENNRSKSKELIRNVARGRDYILNSFKLNDVWLLNIYFSAGDEYVNKLVERYKEIENARQEDDTSSLVTKYSTDTSCTKDLIFLQEFELLESIHIKQYMNNFD